ncbi:MAG: hypothetical protein HOK49_14840 [Opitutae bacterium]|nr:hypothetical protein [Opitutae bacterium]MBT6463791.1 hypothetical protein [Opitutae bacterium]
MKQVPIPLLPNILTLILLPLHIFSATTEFIVTVGDKTGGGLAYRLNSIEAPSLTFALGETYRFKLDGITTADHPFFFSTDDGGGASTEGEYTTGVINSQSSSGFVEITIAVGTPSTLYYYCSAHNGMGNAINVVGTSDTDADGMPDDWETANGLDSNTDDADFDPDGDGANNILEFLSGGDPQIANSFSADSDSDGLSDALENANNLNPEAETTLLEAATKLIDPDEDGITNSLEEKLGLDPAIAESETSLAIATVDPDEDGFTTLLENSQEGLDPAVQNTKLEFANLVVAPDTDEDGFSDGLEISIGTDKDVATSNEVFARAVLDTDEDGIIVDGLDPSSSSLVQAFAEQIVDPDGDGITSEKEVELETDPEKETNFTEIAIKVIDPDNDGFTTHQEEANGQDPNTATTLEDFNSNTGDKDNDGLLDSWELANKAALYSPTETNTFIIDSDGDGLSDILETAQGSEPKSANLPSEFAELLIDPDGDGITTELETLFGLDPMTQNPPTDLGGAGATDQDNDGFTDNLEHLFGLSPSIANTPEEMANKILDPDADGFTSVFENQNGLDPNIANSISDLSEESLTTPPNSGSGQNNPMVNGWFYTENMGWLFTNSSTYPNIFRKNLTNDGGGWLYFLETSTSPLYFFNYSTENWEEH